MKKNIILWCLIFGTIIFINIFFILNKQFYDIIILISILVAGIYDFSKFIIPNTCIIIITIISIFNINTLSIISGIIMFFLTFYFWKNKKMGFGDVKLLTSMALFFNYNAYTIIVLSIFTIYILNINKKIFKVPFGFYLLLGTIEYYFYEVIKWYFIS